MRFKIQDADLHRYAFKRERIVNFVLIVTVPIFNRFEKYTVKEFIIGKLSF